MKPSKKLLVIFALSICSRACGQAPGANYKHLKLFESYVGTWTTYGPLEEDTPFGKKGDIGAATITWRWGANKNSVDWVWDFAYAGQLMGTKGTITWDAATNTLFGCGVGTDGVLIRVMGKSTTSPLAVHVEFTDCDGATSSQIETFSVVNDDTMTLQVTKRTGRGATEKSPVHAFKRVSQKPGPNYEHLKPLEWLIGSWKLELEIDQTVPDFADKGDVYRARLDYEWMLNRSVIRHRRTEWINDKQLGITEVLIGWDAAKKERVEFGFDSAGGRTEGVSSDVGEVIAVQTKTVSPDGKSGSRTLMVKRIDDDTLTGQFTKITEEGEEKPDGPVVEIKRLAK